jgi:hypothetical protein
MKILRASAIVVAAVAALVGGWVGWQKLAPRVTPASQPALVALDEGALAALKRAFNEEKDKTRIVALLSPT